MEEYLLLDVLSNSDNNVQKAADRLVKMGYVKRDTPSKLLLLLLFKLLLLLLLLFYILLWEGVN